MSERFYSANPIRDTDFELSGDEAHHLEKVMRTPPGAIVVVFDGSGCEFRAEVLSYRKGTAALRTLERREISREGAVSLHLGVALPKGDRQKVLIEKLVELGTTRLTPLISRRGVAQPTDGALARLERSVTEACKQCRRNLRMEIAAPQTWERFAAETAADLRLLAHVAPPDGALPSPLPAPIAGTSLVAAVGPEGGWTDEEVAVAVAAGWRIVTLGPRILRVETAAVALAAWAALADATVS